jgi:hypothetical protein
MKVWFPKDIGISLSMAGETPNAVRKAAEEGRMAVPAV